MASTRPSARHCVAHVITGLELGGAQRLLAALLPRLAQRGWEATVLSLQGAHPLADALAPFATVHCLELERRPFTGSAALYRALRQRHVGVVHTWLYHADLLGGLAAALAHRPVLWSLHVPGPDDTMKARTRAVAQLCAGLSPWVPARIACCSPAVAARHAQLGYAAHKLRPVLNGVDVEHFAPDGAAGAHLRQRLALPPEARLIGHPARLHASKDHATLLAAIECFLSRHDQPQRPAHFLLFGEGIEPTAHGLAALATSTSRPRVHLLGVLADPRPTLAGLDLVTLPSRSEALPMALLEAMACGVPAVASDVGDVRLIVGETGMVVPPGDPVALAAAWAQLLDERPEAQRARRAAARERIRRHFALDATADAYAALYAELTRAR